MINLIAGLLQTSLIFQFYGSGLDWQSPETFRPRVHYVYIPQGFDNNDIAQIIAEVEFTNTCAELGRVTVFPHDDHQNVIQLYVEARQRTGEFCIEVINRQLKVIDLGVLPEGEYKVVDFNNLDREYGTLKVRQARTIEIDESNYAPVDSLIVHRDPTDAFSARKFITLAGTFNNTCMVFDDARTRIEKTSPHLIEVLPIVDKLDFDCEDRPVPFLETYEIPDDRTGRRKIDSDRYLFHIRTMNGGSFNKVDHVSMERRSVSGN